MRCIPSFEKWALFCTTADRIRDLTQARVQLTSACMSYIVLRWSQITLDGTWRPIFWLNLSRIQIMWKCRFTPERQDSGLRVRTAPLCGGHGCRRGRSVQTAGASVAGVTYQRGREVPQGKWVF